MRKINTYGSIARRRLCSASFAALAIVATSMAAPQAWAANYIVSDETELRGAVAAAILDGDATATITLDSSITVSSTPFPALNKPLTINANGNTLSGVDGTNPGTSISFAQPAAGGSLTIIGNVQGGDATAAGVAGGVGLQLNGVTITNNGSITGGLKQTGSSNPTAALGGVGGGQGLVLTDGTLINNGTITGGDGAGATTASGIGVVLDGGTGHVNNGTIQGGLIAPRNGQPGLIMRDTDLVNNGIIRGGTNGSGNFNNDGVYIWGTSRVVNNEDGEIYGADGNATLRGGDGITLWGSVDVTIENRGLIRGADQSATTSIGTFAINASSNPFQGVVTSGVLTVVNSGTIAAGDEGNNDPTAIQLFSAVQLILELRAGSIIDGLVLTNGAVANDVFRLGGTENASFDVSSIGSAEQYRGFDIFEKTGSSTWTIEGVGDGQAAPWDIYEGTLLMSAGSDLGNGPVDVFGGILAGVGTVGSTTHHTNGTIAPGINGIGTLTIDGDYIGNGGLLAIETMLGDDSSATDLLSIIGGTTGTTQVQVTNLGGVGGQTVEGIKIVDVAGSSDGDFSLLGEVVVNGEQALLEGAYAYSLFQGSVSDPDDGDWYLRSAGFSPTVTSYESYAGVLLGLIEMPTFQQRRGNIYMPSNSTGTDGFMVVEPTADVAGYAPPPGNVWARIEAPFGHFEGNSDSGTEYDLSRFRVQIGIDGQLSQSDSGMLIAGINAQYGHANADLSSDTGDGENATDSFGGGLGLTWLGKSGSYVDAQASAHYLQSDLSSDVVGELVNNNEGSGYGLSLEAGHKLNLDEAWSVTPQAQLAYTSVDFDDFTDPFGADVSLEKGESLKGRIGLALGHDSFDGESRAHVYAVANLTYEFLGEQSVDVAGVNVAFEPQKLGGELGLGGTYEWAGGKYAIQAEALGQSSFEGSYGIKAIVGFSTRF